MPATWFSFGWFVGLLILVGGCASVPVTPDRSVVTEGMVWEHYFKYGERNPRPCRPDEFPQFTGTLTGDSAHRYSQAPFDFLNGEWFFLYPDGKAKHLAVFRNQSSTWAAEGPSWMALVDGETRRYWVVTGSGWGGERYEGPYSLEAR